MKKINVLIVDDEKEVTRLVKETLQREGYATSVAYDGQEALNKFKRHKPDLVILDINLPKIDGFTVCKKIKTSKVFVPTIIITGKFISLNDKIEGLRMGADDYLIKPFDIAELIARVRTMSHLKGMYKELNILNKRLTQLSVHDPLTGAYNRRYLVERIESEIKRSIRAKSTISSMIIDLDDFKPLNDNYSHLFGDAILQQVAKFLKQNIRQTDVLARYGGDEFFIITPDTDKKGASVLANKLLKKLDKTEFKAEKAKVKLKMSIGISSFDGKSIKRKIVSNQLLKSASKGLMKKTDKALYEAKKKGRNRLSVM